MSDYAFTIAILSGKGGVGKTTISLNLAKELSHRGPVWLIDIDLFNRGATSALWESEKQIPLSVAELILDAQRLNEEQGAGQTLVQKFTEKLRSARGSLAYDNYLTFVPAARAVEGKEASYVLWHGMAERGLHAEVLLGALIEACAAITPGGIVVLDGHGGLDELSLASALISDTCYIVNEADLVTFTGSVTLFREILEQASKSPHEPWIEFIINRVAPNRSIKNVAAQFGPMLDAMSPAPEPVAVYFPLEPELFGVFGQDPFVSELYTRYWFSRKIKFLSERVLDAGTSTGSLDKEQWKRPTWIEAQPASARTALRREWHKRGDLLLIGWLSTSIVLLGTLSWLLLSLLLKETFSTAPPLLLWFLIVGSLTVHLIATIRWARVELRHLSNIRKLRGKPMRRLRFGDTESARLREKMESEVKEKKASKPLAVALGLIVVLGVLIAIVVPNFMTALQRSKQKRSMADMRTIATAWEARATDVNKYNAAGQVASDVTFPQGVVESSRVVEMLAPTYIRSLPVLDGWGNPYVFTTDQPIGGSEAAQAYGIRSVGRDGKADLGAPIIGGTTSFDCDIIYANGTFLQYPEGVQGQ